MPPPTKDAQPKGSAPHGSQPSQPEPALLLCSPPSDRSGPSFVLMLRRPILFEPPPLLRPDQLGQVGIACTSLVTIDDNGDTHPAVTPYFGLDATFAQTWNL